jgi:hypothetical protein
MPRRKPVTEQIDLPRVERHFAGAVSALLFGALEGELHSAILRIAADDAG